MPLELKDVSVHNNRVGDKGSIVADEVGGVGAIFASLNLVFGND